jgi:hypothetical protein
MVIEAAFFRARCLRSGSSSEMEAYAVTHVRTRTTVWEEFVVAV